MAGASQRLQLLPTIAILLIGVGVFAMVRDRMAAPGEPCDPLEVGCDTPARGVLAQPEAARIFDAADVCPNTGYLCAELEQRERIRLQRFKGFDGTLVVHVPRPDFEGPADAAQLQRAASVGIRAWDNQPFPILIDTRGDRNPHFSVQWTRSLGGSQIGVARTQWSPTTGLTVVSIELATRSPFRPDAVSDYQSVRLIAAHEMGHALGLGHSDSQRDVMYPTNTASSVSAQDRRTMESLYALPDGTEIRR